MENTIATTTKGHTAGCNFARRSSAARLIVRMGLGALAMLLWQAAPVKAQECCPDQSTAAEMAKLESASKKPVKMQQTAKMQQGNAVTSVKMNAGAATAGNRKVYAKAPAVKETAQTAEPVSNGNGQSKDGSGGR